MGDRGRHHLGADGDDVVPNSGENPPGILPARQDVILLLIKLVSAGPSLQPPVLHQELAVLLNPSEPVDVWKFSESKIEAENN